MNKPSKLAVRGLPDKVLQLLPNALTQREQRLALSLVKPKRGYASELEMRWLQSAVVIRLSNGIVARSWGEGPRVLLVHGWNARGTQLCSYIEPLVRRGYEVVAIDLPGHGDSTGSTLTPLKARDALLTVGEELGPLHSIVAHGYGAGVALWAIGKGMDVGRLVMLAGWSKYLWREYAALAQLPARSLKRLEEHLEKILKHPPKRLSVENIAPRIDKPVLLVNASAEASDESLESVQRLLPSANVTLLDGLNHMDLLFEPRAVEEVMQFVNNERPAHRAA